MQLPAARSSSPQHAAAPPVQPAAAARRVVCPPRRRVLARAQDSSTDRIAFDKLLLTIMDDNPYLSDGSRQAIATAAALAQLHNSTVTVLVVDKQDSTADPSIKLQTINRAMHEAGCAKVDVLEKKEEASPGAALLGDVADDVSADLCILSSECIHSKRVDANLLAEFVNCPLLLLP